jgi:hypothetical protein
VRLNAHAALMSLSNLKKLSDSESCTYFRNSELRMSVSLLSVVGHGLVARMSGDGPGASSLRASVKPAASNQLLISSNE